MNFGEIKAFLGDKPQASPNEGIRQQLREEGLRQASQGVASGSASSVSKFSSQTTIGLRIYNNSLNQQLEVADKRPNLPAPDNNEKSLFDFEEVAKNVLRFVGGVISGAARGGADQDSLTQLFEQARSGVAKGIKMAEKDLAGFLNEEITDGISRSADLIEQGIQRLQEDLLNGGQEKDNKDQKGTISRTAESLSIANEDSGELSIRTRDGDQVTIRFESFQQFEFNRQVVQEQPTQPAEPIERNDVMPPEAPVTDATEAPQGQPVPLGGQQPVTAGDESPQFQAQTLPAAVETVNQQAVFMQQQNLSFSVSGELDEAELESIGELVNNANDLANTFFAGDVETAFQQALELGFDEQELTGFALQLTRQEQVEVVKVYESVSQYDGDTDPERQSSKPVERVSDYMRKMLNVLDQSQQKLESGDQFEKLLNRLINRMQDIDTNDLVSAINEFHSFNNKLLRNLPENSTQAEQS